MSAKKSSNKNEFISNNTCADSFRKGWSLMRNNFWPFIAVILIVTVIEGFNRTILESIGAGFTYISQVAAISIPILLGLVAGFLVIAPLRIGSAWIFLKAARKEKYKVEDVFAVFSRNYKQAVIGSILSFLYIVGGLILFVIPGLIIAFRLSFFNFIVVDEQLKAKEALQKSWDMTKGHVWTLFFMWLLTFPIVIVGLLLFLIGLIPAISWLSSAYAVLYHSVASQK